MSLRLRLLAGLLTLAAVAPAAEVRLTRLADRVRIEIGGSLFTEYIFGDGASRPYCYPVQLADGTALTRDFPMRDTPGEERDHPHQRALMFAHGDVNGIDFWNEGKAGPPLPKGHIVLAGLDETSSGSTGVLRARHRWLAPDGRLVATDETTLRFHDAGGGDRLLDYTVTLHALPDTPLVLGDSKEGTMAIRLASWLTPPRQIKGRPVPGTGRILNAAGDRDAAAWGRRADWCAFTGAHDGRTYGVALFDHPDNLRHPTWWMARDYGLLAANPFGQHEFEPDQKHPRAKGNHTIPADGHLTLRYRFYFHAGDPATARVAARYADYAAGR